MLRTILLSLAVLATATTAPCQDEAKVLRTFDKAFTAAKEKRPAASTDERKEALAATAGLDSGKVAKTLVEGWENLATERAAIDALRHEYTEEMARLIKGQETSENRTLPQDRHDRYNELKPLVVELRTWSDDLLALQLAVGDRIAELRRRDSLLWLLTKVCGNKKAELPLRLAAARAVGGGAVEVLDELATAMDRAKQPEEQIALLDAMALAGPTARLHATPVIEALDSKEDAVAERAALALAKLAVPEAIGPMIGLLERSSGQMRQRVVAAVEVLTGEEFGDNIGAWKTWWQQEGPAIASGGRELGKGVPSNRKATNEFYYFGIPQDQSDSILYVIDCSGSMKNMVTMESGAAAGQEMSRLEACKAELIRALGLLRPTQKFAILWYNDLPHWWEPEMQLATPKAIERAQEYVAKFRPASSTNIHDSLEQAFTLVGRGGRDNAYEVVIDTIFLLTDGSPTTPDGKLDSTEKILVGVRAWNALKRVTIHCIAIGKDLNEKFLRDLASENGGEFKQY